VKPYKGINHWLTTFTDVPCHSPLTGTDVSLTVLKHFLPGEGYTC